MLCKMVFFTCCVSLFKKKKKKVEQPDVIIIDTKKERLVEGDEECPICLNQIEKYPCIKCGHAFHWKCLSSWLSRSVTCPICRTKITDKLVSPTVEI